MGKAANKPLIDAEGEARAPTAEEWHWAVRGEDFSSALEVHGFLMRRKEFLLSAAAAGIDSSAFRGLQPGKPGFIGRAVAAMEILLDQTKPAAE